MNIAIIGAGMAGLTAAKALSEHHDVIVFDKSRGISGRMSTRYAGLYEFDHGAQYFTVKDPGFQNVVDAAVTAGHLAHWDARALYQTDKGWAKDTGGKRYAGTPRMNSWLKGIGANLNIKTGVRITGLNRARTWTLKADNGETYAGFDHVILAVPSVQAQALLPRTFKHIPAVKAAKLDACFALMLGFETPLDLEWDSLRIKNSPIDWVANNSSKPGRSSEVTSLVVHASAGWSEEYKDAPREWVNSQMCDALYSVTGISAAAAAHTDLHRWLYSSVAISPDKPCLHDPDLDLVVAGDWCAGGRVEGAYLSGQAAAQAILGG